MAQSEIPKLGEKAEQRLLDAIELDSMSIDSRFGLAKPITLKLNCFTTSRQDSIPVELACLTGPRIYLPPVTDYPVHFIRVTIFVA